jgi:hypothetical protein
MTSRADVVPEDPDRFMRACPRCLKPLRWIRNRYIQKERKGGVITGQHDALEEIPKCSRCGILSWWRIVEPEAGRVVGFSTLRSHGGRLYQRPVTVARMIEHTTRALVLGFKRRGKPVKRQPTKLRNRARGRLVLHIEQAEFEFMKEGGIR